MKPVCLAIALFFCAGSAKADIVEGVLFGDSFSNNTVDWPSYTEVRFKKFAFGGRTLANISANFTSELSEVTKEYDTIMVMAGINDLFRDSIQLSDLQMAVTDIIDAAPTEKTLVLSTLPPAAGHVLWNNDKQIIADQYNDWLSGIDDIYLFDLNAVLDVNGDNHLDTQWDAGDGLHPSIGANGGMGHIGRTYDRFAQSVPEPGFGIVAAICLFGVGFRKRA